MVKEKEGDRIVGIKAIAEYLDTSERSVYRWEKELGLPLHRVSGTAGSSVYVYTGELENWLKKREAADKTLDRSRKSLVLFVFSVSAIFLIAVAIAYFILKSRQIWFKTDIPNPTIADVSGNVVHIKDSRGKNIWHYVTHFDKLDPEAWRDNKGLDFRDIDNDGENEVAGRVYEPATNDFFLTLFDNDGKILWKKSFADGQTTDGLHFKSNYNPIRILFAKGKGGRTFIVSYWQHTARFFSFILSHDLMGRLVNKYTHTGHLESVEIHDLDHDGIDEILFTGTNNLLRGEGVLGMLGLSNFRGVCPPGRIEPEYSHLAYRLESYIPDEPDPGNQLLYLRFKRLHHFEEKQQTYIYAALCARDDGLIHAQLFPFDLRNQSPPCCFEYIFNTNFELLYVIPDSLMIKAYTDIAQGPRREFSLGQIVEAYSKSVFRWENGSWVAVAQIL